MFTYVVATFIFSFILLMISYITGLLGMNSISEDSDEVGKATFIGMILLPGSFALLFLLVFISDIRKSKSKFKTFGLLCLLSISATLFYGYMFTPLIVLNNKNIIVGSLLPIVIFFRVNCH